MFGFIAGIPNRVRYLFSKFKKYFTKPQYRNFCRTYRIRFGQGSERYTAGSS